jgi:chromosome segregation ATPase
MQEQLRNVIDSCSALLTQADELAGLTAEIAKAKGVLEAAKAEHASVQAKLNDDGALLEQRQREAIQSYDREVFSKMNQLRQLQMQVESTRSQLAELQSAAAIARSQHDEVTTSLAQLRRRIAGA